MLSHPLQNTDDFDYHEFKQNLKTRNSNKKKKQTFPKVDKTYKYDPSSYTWMNELMVDEFDMEDCDVGSCGSDYSEEGTENQINSTEKSSAQKYLKNLKDADPNDSGIFSGGLRDSIGVGSSFMSSSSSNNRPSRPSKVRQSIPL